jgi:hypothetical protein
MIVIKTEDGKAEILRNKRKGFKLITRLVKSESKRNRCIWCSLRFNPICFPTNNPCDLFLPDIIFFEDAKNNTRRRRKGKVDSE